VLQNQMVLNAICGFCMQSRQKGKILPFASAYKAIDIPFAIGMKPMNCHVQFATKFADFFGVACGSRIARCNLH